MHCVCVSRLFLRHVQVGVCTFVVAALRGIGALRVGLSLALRWDFDPYPGPRTVGWIRWVAPSLVCASPVLALKFRQAELQAPDSYKNNSGD